MSFQIKWWGKAYRLPTTPLVPLILTELSYGARSADQLHLASNSNLRSVQRILQALRRQGLAACEETWYHAGSQRVWYGKCSAALRKRIEAVCLMP